MLYSVKVRIAFCVKQNPLISGFPVWFRLVDATRMRHRGFSFCSQNAALRNSSAAAATSVTKSTVMKYAGVCVGGPRDGQRMSRNH